ncbi:hypothetical protein D3C80_1950350 [compost metagenome]
MAEVAQGIARALERVFGMGEQVIDLRYQRLQLCRYPSIELCTRTLLQLGNLLSRSLQRAQ